MNERPAERMRIFYLIFFQWLILISAEATHIVGGYFSYQSLPNDQYAVHLVIYRDCFNGVPPFDDPAMIAVYDQNDSLVANMAVSPTDSLDVFVNDVCMPVGVCIRKANYHVTLTLPNNTGLYTLVYQRCCRSGLIQNLIGPLDVGMTYTTVINSAISNNSPLFNHEFAAFTYQGISFSFDASATDPDGDSLAYYLEDALDGASIVDPYPSTPSPPPYAPLLWQPPYSQADMLGGPSPLTIDVGTGEMTALPGMSGVFEICHRVDEYRGGVLINSVRREFVMVIEPAVYYDIPGTVTVNANTLPLDNGKAWLVRLNLLDSTLTAVDTNTVSNGGFLHPLAVNGKYLAKASADSLSPFYPNNIPTYYGDVLYWYQATFISTCTGTFPSADIHMIRGNNTGGPGFVGGLISEGANRMMTVPQSMKGITVVLIDSSGQPSAWGITDAGGIFGIANLSPGTYRVEVDKLGAYIDNSIGPVITVDPLNPVAGNLNFILHDTWLELSGYTATENPQAATGFSAYPNPFTHQLMIRISSPSKTIVTLHDIAGKIIRHEIIPPAVSGSMETWDFSGTGLSPGVYFLRAENRDFTRVIKVVHQEQDEIR